MTRPSASRIPAVADLDRMQSDRMDRLQDLLAEQGNEALILLSNTDILYATGAIYPIADASRESFERPAAVVVAGDRTPHLFAAPRIDERVRATLPADHLHGAVHLDFDEGAEAFVAELAELVPTDAVLAIDSLTHSLRRAFGGRVLADGGKTISRAKLHKTPDELACLRRALAITEAAITEVQAGLAPGIKQTDLTATFLRHVFEAGADANMLDPIWQVMPLSMADGPWTTTGGLASPLLTTERELAEGDVLWVDCSLSFGGFQSDFGRTWIVGREPSRRQRDQFERWIAIRDAVLARVKAGVTNSELTAAAIDVAGPGDKPWMPHFYLGHGLGIDAAEMPFIGSDIGEAFDAAYVLEDGMVAVFEPLVWDDGAAGYRSEEVILITADGWEPLTDYSYDPF